MATKELSQYVALADVWGGRMWYIWSEKQQRTFYFWWKYEARDFIREEYKDDPEKKKALLDILFKEYKGVRSVCYA